ncbi:MAG: hypothetical protein ACTSXV_00905, partial [Alphaproteobacteria bacterium]
MLYSCLKNIDPSRYTVYQLLIACNIEIKEHKTDTFYAIKTVPFINSLYNFVHVLSDNFSETDLSTIHDFFGTEEFRLKTPLLPIVETLLMKNNFVKKGDVEVDMKLNLEDFNSEISIPKSINLKQIATQKQLDDYHFVLSESFNHDLPVIQKKFGFFNSIILDKNDPRVSGFILYEN